MSSTRPTAAQPRKAPRSWYPFGISCSGGGHMSREAQVAWLRTSETLLLGRFTQAARDTTRFPGFAALGRVELDRAMRREVSGLESFLRGDFEGVKEAIGEHKQDALTFMGGIPVDEQLAFLEHRLAIVEQMLDADPHSASFRDSMRSRLQAAVGYYRSIAHNLNALQTLRKH